MYHTPLIVMSTRLAACTAFSTPIWPRALRATSLGTARPLLTLPFGHGSVLGVCKALILTSFLASSLTQHFFLEYSGLSSIDEFPNVKKWLYKLLARPGFEEGRNAPGPHRYLKMNEMSEEELNAISASLGTWIQDAMKKDAEA